MIQQETCVQFTSDQFSVPFANLSCLKWLSHDHSVTGCTYINITELPFIFGCFFHFRFHMSTYEVDFHCQTVHVDIKLSGFSAPVVAAVSRDTWEPYLSFAAKILLRLFHLSICDRQKSFKSRGNVVHAIQPSTLFTLQWIWWPPHGCIPSLLLSLFLSPKIPPTLKEVCLFYILLLLTPLTRDHAPWSASTWLL